MNRAELKAALERNEILVEGYGTALETHWHLKKGTKHYFSVDGLTYDSITDWSWAWVPEYRTADFLADRLIKRQRLFGNIILSK
jgi:hypothetical protein